MAKALTTYPEAPKGIVRLAGAGVPNGSVVVSRTSDRRPDPVRGGEFLSTTGGFAITDSEPIYGKPMLYRATVSGISQAARFIQSNRVLNPKAGVDTANATTGPNRTLTRETSAALRPPRDALTSFRVSPYTAGASNPTDRVNRTLLSEAVSGFDVAGTYQVTAQVMYDSPDQWLWSDAKAAGTWQTIKNKGNWQQVKTSGAPASATTAFASVWAAVVSPTNSVVVNPFLVLGATTSRNKEWMGVSFSVTIPAGAPANSRLVLLHGTAAREFACTWWLSTIMVTPAAEWDAGSLFYFDGDTALPANPAYNLVPDYDWTAASNDASIAWNGTANNSVSVFYGPSALTATDTVELLAGDIESEACEPVLLSDPVLPTLGLWFGLLGISELSFAERAQLYDVLSKGPQIAVSQVRAWASGSFSLMTSTLEEAELAERMFGTGRILLVRNPNPAYPESNWYLHLGTVTQGRLGPDHRRPERRWTVPFVRVERPIGLITASSGVTWLQAKEGYGTWSAVRTRPDDWLDVASKAPALT